MNFQECLNHTSKEKQVDILSFQQASCFRLYSHTLNHITLEAKEKWRWKSERANKTILKNLFEKKGSNLFIETFTSSGLLCTQNTIENEGIYPLIKKEIPFFFFSIRMYINLQFLIVFVVLQIFSFDFSWNFYHLACEWRNVYVCAVVRHTHASKLFNDSVCTESL